MTAATTIRLSELAGEIEREWIDEADALRPGDEREMVIVCASGGRLAIVDGFHRTAGYLRWARELGKDAADVSLTVIETDDDALIAVAAEPSDRQRAALDAIYALVAE